MRFEAGTHNYPGIASLYAGIRFITSIGQEAIEKKNTDLTRCFIRELKDTQGITIYNEKPDLPVVSFDITGIDNHEAGFILARAYNVIMGPGCTALRSSMNALTAGKVVSGQVSRISIPAMSAE